MMFALPNGDVVVQSTRCRTCLSDRIWECEIDKQLYCMNCEPPGKVVPKLIQERMLAKRAREAQMQKLEDEMEDDNERLLFTQRTGKTS